jgi:hypothetical protein
VRFARVVFWIAGIWGVLVIAPLFFMMDLIGTKNPPAVTHPEFYYGFAIVTLMWQVSFFIIASDPARFRPLMLPPALAKLGYAVMAATLLAQGRLDNSQLLFEISDLVLALLFILAYLKLRNQPA